MVAYPIMPPVPPDTLQDGDIEPSTGVDPDQDACDQANAEPPANGKPRKPRRDPEARKAYMRDLMRRRRASAHVAEVAAAADTAYQGIDTTKPLGHRAGQRALANRARADLPDIVRRYAAGASMQTLAAEYGVHRQRLYEWLLGGAGDAAYGDLVTSVLVRRVADADAALESAEVEPDTARAAQRARFARMDLERRRPALYGSSPVIALNVAAISVDALLGERLVTRLAGESGNEPAG